MASATLAAMPFLDALECSQVLGHAERTVYWRLREMERAGLACSLYHSLPSGHGSRRFALTTKGLGDLAQQQRVTLEELIARYPISDHWYRTLLVRLDHVALLYRAAASIVQGAGASPFRWRRRGPIDAVISLPGGVHLALSCRGPASNKISYAPRFRRIWRDHYPSAVFIILPSANDLREMRQRMDSLPLPVFTTTSLHLAQSSPESPVWFTPAGGHPVRPGEAVSLLTAAPQPPGERPMRRLKPPGPLCYAAEAPPRHMLASALFPTEKVVLSLLYEWPWLRQGHIPSLLGITPKHVSKVISRLDRFGLVAERTGRLETSLALSDQALRYIAQKDRIPVHLTLRRWSTAPIDPTAPFHWRNVVGTRARQLLRDMEHTEAVHDFLAQLGNEVRGGAWELSYLQPPPLAVRHFSHGLERHSIQPDAFVGITGGLLPEAPSQGLFLEWERRAIRPVTMRARLAPYLQYYATRRPVEDNGLVPTLLVVFEDELASYRFFRVARQAMAGAGVQFPLGVSDRGTLESHGVLGAGWRWLNALRAEGPFSTRQ